MNSDSSLPSSSSSTELIPYQELSNCEICGKTAHGYHHGALTCRACCIFFRRSAGTTHHWKCKYNERCGLNKDGNLCKKCRLAKCFERGMHVDNFQLNRDAYRQTVGHRRYSDMPTSLEKFIGRPHVIIRCEPKPSKTSKFFVDLSGLVDKGFYILSKKYKHDDERNSVQKLATHMRESRKMNLHGNVIYRKMGKEENLRFWEIDFCKAAEWLSHFDEFQELPLSLRMEFLKSTWILRSTLERVVLTAEKRLKSGSGDNCVPLDNNAAIDAKNFEVDLSWCTHYEKEKMGYFLEMFVRCKNLYSATKLLMDLKPTEVEQNFLFLQICFSYAGKLYRGEIQEISEKLIETVSDQMHDYYSNVLKMPNYSGRISRLLKCEKFIQNFINMRKQRIEIGQIFDIFNIQYSHPEMFTNFGYS